jgi:ATP-binding cassette subfamily B protein
MGILRRILALTLGHKWRLIGAYTCMVGATAAYLILPRLFGEAIDKIDALLRGGGVEATTIFTISAAILAMSTLRGILSFGQVYLGESLGLAVVYQLRNRFFDHVQRLSFGFHDRQHTGNLMSRAITDIESLRMFVNAALLRTPYFLILFIAVAIIIFRLDWRLGLVAGGFMPVVAVMSIAVRVRLRRIWLSIQETMGELSTVLQENLTGVRVVKAFASDEFEEAKFDAKNADVSAKMVKAAQLQALNSSTLMFALLIAMGLMLWVGGSRVINGQITPGELAQVLFYLQILSVPVRHVGQLINSYARAISAGQRLFEILDTESPVRESDTPVQMPRARGHVIFDGVRFSYSNGVPVLKNIDIDAEPGTVTALLGAPGSGKSSIVHLIPRFYDASSGRITLDGVDVRDATLASLRSNVGIVQQDVFLFSASLRENIAYGRENATTDEIVEAARVAQLDGYIRSLDNGYETVIGERGVTLSGGQRQRLSIARAVLLDPPVLILDDSTASVDASTEELIRNAMVKVMHGRTTFVIAHRLSTVHRADQILVLKDGEIRERGTHLELHALGGLYREIYDLQLRPQEEVMMDFEMPARAVKGHSQ